MVVLVVYVLVLLVLWWAWLRQLQDRPGAGSAAPTPPQRPAQGPAPAAAPDRRRPRRPRSLAPPLTEDDVIAFGLALERSADVVRQAVSDPSRAPAGQRARRDVPGP